MKSKQMTCTKFHCQKVNVEITLFESWFLLPFTYFYIYMSGILELIELVAQQESWPCSEAELTEKPSVGGRRFDTDMKILSSFRA
jgi:hypothetical protein